MFFIFFFSKDQLNGNMFSPEPVVRFVFIYLFLISFFLSVSFLQLYLRSCAESRLDAECGLSGAGNMRLACWKFSGVPHICSLCAPQ